MSERRKEMRSTRNLLVALACGALVFTAELILAQQTSSPTPTSPVQNELVMAGPLEISPGKAFLKLWLNGSSTMADATVRFKIRNTSDSDVKVIMFQYSLSATDSLGYAVLSPDHLYYTTTSGVMFSDLRSSQWGEVFEREKSKFVTLSPKQSIQVELKDARSAGNSDFFRAHRPETTSFSATLAVVDVGGTATNRSFSFDEMPLTVVAGK
jgi:hypothetical protein